MACHSAWPSETLSERTARSARSRSLHQALSHAEPPDTQLRPTDARARARAAAAEMRSGFTDLRSALPMNFRPQRTGLTREAAVEEEIRRIMEIWQDWFERYEADGPYLFGAFCITDAMFASVISRFQKNGVSAARIARGLHGCNLEPSLDVEWGTAAEYEPPISRYGDI